MSDTVTAREFLLNTFNTDFLSEEEKETIIKAMELFAMGMCREQRRLVVDEVMSINPEILKYPQDLADAVIATPLPKFETL